ncbi:MAG: aminopeptidase N [Halobacteriovoraceae bacterium]|nr:aminopeptidase N [Halobacteriovoraceae bacterium]
MKDNTPKPVYLREYKKPEFLIESIYLTFRLDSTKTYVHSKMEVRRNPETPKSATSSPSELVLNGEEITFESVSINGKKLEKTDYVLGGETLRVKAPLEKFTLEIENFINPEENKALDGLYKSGNIFCTQNEPEGFRRITYYLDRPDVMAKFTTKVIADKKSCPVLLSNGNPIESGDLEGGQHYVVWEDPFLKPCYLYALVAGDLGLVQDEYTTGSGRKIDLRIYCDKGNEGKCSHAMESLKNSMKWDEDVYGLEYDLDIYMIVAVDAFNMGAMENKGLNIFNTSCVLANPKTATDRAFQRIEGVVSHEYFHNWTGNRVTCRDWFQLTLKEGLTVFRDQEFSSDMNSRSVQRIEDVQNLKQGQFIEDAGPTSHPIKPDTYLEINNFYTSTIYEKGSEVIRMIQTFLGKEGFRKGMDKYFELFDGQAVTTEDFLHAMSVANDNFDFSQFKNWYNQSGTPQLYADFFYSKEEKTFTLKLKQKTPLTPGQNEKLPFHFPLKMGLISKNGQELPLKLKDESFQPQLKDGILHVRHEEESFVFENISEKPLASINRGFSAPIRLMANYSNEDLAFLMANDRDEFNRFEAGQTYAMRIIEGLILKSQNGEALQLPESYIEAFGGLMDLEGVSHSFKAKCLCLPTEELIYQNQNVIDVESTFHSINFLRKTLASVFKDKFLKLYNDLNDRVPYDVHINSIGKREVKNRCLAYLMELDTPEVVEICVKQFEEATNMTDELGALAAINDSKSEERKKVMGQFYEKWKHETLVIQMWLSLQGSSSLPDTLSKVKELESSPVYDKTIPNIVRSLLGAYANNNIHFHSKDGLGYEYIAEKILELDSVNPQVASRLAGAFRPYQLMVEENRKKMEAQLIKMKAHPNLSKNVYEIVSKILDN